MSNKTYVPEGEVAPLSQIGATLDALAATIEDRKSADGSSYTNRLIYGPLDTLLKKVSEEALEMGLAAKEAQMLDAYSESAELYGASIDHLRYEAADVVYHLMVVLARFDISLEEFAAELNTRMRDEERPEGGALLYNEHIKRGK